MRDSIIAAVAAAGFGVYMRDKNDTWLIFVDDANLGYLQNNDYGGFSISTLHMANRTTGTGFRVAEDLSEVDLTRDKLAEAFVVAPAWAMRDAATVRKWRGINDYKRSCSFNAEYRLVASAVESFNPSARTAANPRGRV